MYLSVAFPRFLLSFFLAFFVLFAPFAVEASPGSSKTHDELARLRGSVLQLKVFSDSERILLEEYLATNRLALKKQKEVSRLGGRIFKAILTYAHREELKEAKKSSLALDGEVNVKVPQAYKEKQKARELIGLIQKLGL